MKKNDFLTTGLKTVGTTILGTAVLLAALTTFYGIVGFLLYSLGKWISKDVSGNLIILAIGGILLFLMALILEAGHHIGKEILNSRRKK